MMFTAVHLDERGQSVRWRVENSWVRPTFSSARSRSPSRVSDAPPAQGPEACNKGFVVMTDAWFSEYLFQIVAPRCFVAPELLDIYDNDHVTPLPPWDVLG